MGGLRFQDSAFFFLNNCLKHWKLNVPTRKSTDSHQNAEKRRHNPLHLTSIGTPQPSRPAPTKTDRATAFTAQTRTVHRTTRRTRKNTQRNPRQTNNDREQTQNNRRASENEIDSSRNKSGVLLLNVRKSFARE